MVSRCRALRLCGYCERHEARLVEMYHDALEHKHMLVTWQRVFPCVYPAPTYRSLDEC